MRTMADQFDDALFRDRLVATLSVLFGVLATLLAAIGLYGVIAYSVSRQRREIGIRMALGAGQALVLRMVLREALTLSAVGVLVGLPLAYALGRAVEAEVFGLSSTDAPTLLLAAVTLSAVSLVAGWLPARRAARIDPALTLRQD